MTQLIQSETGSQELCPIGAWAQGIGPSSTVLPGRQPGTGPQVEQPGLKLALTQDADAAGGKVRMLCHQGPLTMEPS